MVLMRNSKPFEAQRLEEERSQDKGKIFTIRLNDEDYKQLIDDMRVLKQPKEGTAIKQLWQVGRNVLHDSQTGLILRSIIANDTRNKRIGIMDIEGELPANVTQKDGLL